MDEKLAKSLEEKSVLVNDALAQFLHVEPEEAVENLHDGILYALGLDQTDPSIQGKRIRPALCLLTCEALGGDYRQSLPFAMAIELMHNFFLVHDDIEDGDLFRRGRPSVWKQFGHAHAINIGDFLLTKVFVAFLTGDGKKLPPDLQVSLLELLNDTLERTHIGQTLDLNALGRDSITIKQYLDIVTNKTSCYLSAPMIGGALIAGADPATLQAIRDLGRKVGPVFQIIDDVIDLTRGKGRESVGSDIREGKRSFLVAHTSSKASEEERLRLFHILNLPRDETTGAHIEEVRQLFEKHESIPASRAFCGELMEEAHLAMAPAPERLRRTLLDVFDDMLDRKQ